MSTIPTLNPGGNLSDNPAEHGLLHGQRQNEASILHIQKQLAQALLRLDDLEVQAAKHDERSRGAALQYEALAERVMLQYMEESRRSGLMDGEDCAKAAWRVVRAFEAARNAKADPKPCPNPACGMVPPERHLDGCPLAYDGVKAAREKERLTGSVHRPPPAKEDGQ